MPMPDLSQTIADSTWKGDLYPDPSWATWEGEGNKYTKNSRYFFGSLTGYALQNPSFPLKSGRPESTPIPA